jgi:hypothetical protein
MADFMPPLQKRPDVPTVRPRFPTSSVLWIGAAGLVGLGAILVVLSIQDHSGKVPPTSTFAAAAIAMSLIGIVTVALAARSAGTTWRAAIALGGGFAAIAVAKFGMGPTALYQGNRVEDIENFGGLTSGGMVVLIAVIVGVLYLAAIWLLAVLFRPAKPPDGPSGKVVVGLSVLAIGGTVVTGMFVSTASSQYVTFATTGLEASGIALALFVAAGLVALAFRGTAVRSRVLGQASMYITVLWVAIAFLLVFQVLWIVFLLAIVAIWPFRSVTPK